MPTNELLKLALRRFMILLFASVLIVWIGSEIAYSFLKSDLDRPPEIVVLAIPNGTAARVATGFDEPSQIYRDI